MRKRPQLREYAEDARPFLRRTDARYDAIFVDAYRQPYIPFYLSTHEFFELARDRLAPGGVVVVNVGHPEGNDELEKVLTATMGTVFPIVARDPVEADQHAADRRRRRRSRATTCAPRVARACPAELRPLALATADAARAAGCAAATSTPTTRRRSSG